MRKGLRRIEHIICTILTLTAVLICGCVQKEEFIKNISVTIADSLFFTPSVSATRVKAGDDLTVTLEMLHGYEFVSCDYENYSVMPVGLGAVKLTLHDICVPSRVTVTTQLRQTDNSREEINCSVSYNLNGGDYEGKSELTYNYTLTEHLRPNTWNGQGIKKDGYTIIGWNTQSDGNGEHIGLGSRVTVGDGENITLYAEWVKWLPEEDFLYRTHPDGTAAVTGYRGDGNEEMFVIPAEIDGYAINEIAGSLTTNIPCGKIISPVLVLPDTITSISGGAFTNSAFREIYFFDNIEFIADNSFPYNITTYHINAALAPRYQAVNNSTYYADCVDRLITTGDKKQIIFFAGCSTAYGINSPMVQAAAGEDYAVCNLGVNGDINGAFQLEVILHYISEGDILVHTPEVMSAPQLMSSFYLDGRAFIMCEGNYDLLSIPDFSESDLIFKKELDTLVSDKVKVVYVLSDEKKEGYESGFIGAELLQKYVSGDYTVMMCGPQAMYAFADKELASLGLPLRRIKKEANCVGLRDAEAKSYTLTVHIGFDTYTVPADARETILTALERAGLKVPSKCRAGGCGFCHSKLVSGSFSIAGQDKRRLADAKFGYIHPCCSYPDSDMELIVPKA